MASLQWLFQRSLRSRRAALIVVVASVFLVVAAPGLLATPGPAEVTPSADGSAPGDADARREAGGEDEERDDAARAPFPRDAPQAPQPGVVLPGLDVEVALPEPGLPMTRDSQAPTPAAPPTPSPGRGDEAPAGRADCSYEHTLCSQRAGSDADASTGAAVATARVVEGGMVQPEWTAAAVTGLGFLAILALFLSRWVLPAVAWAYGVLPAAWRMDRDVVLAHPTRRAVLAHLETHPGATLMELAGAADVGGSRAAYHIMILIRETLVSVRELHGRKVYFSRGAPRVELEQVVLRRAVDSVAHPARAPGRMLSYVRAAPGATVTQMARALGFGPGHVHYHLTRLVERGFLYRVRQGRHVRHYLTMRGVELARETQPARAQPQAT